MAGRVAHGLKILYGRWLGELQWIETPPKTRMRRSRGRDAFVEDAPARAARAEEIRRALPQIAYVIGIYDPEWRPELAKIVRPVEKTQSGPPQGWTAGALDALRNAERPLSSSEIVEEICERFDIDPGDVVTRQKRYRAVHTSLEKTYSDHLDSDGGKPKRWALRSKGLIS